MSSFYILEMATEITCYFFFFSKLWQPLLLAVGQNEFVSSRNKLMSAYIERKGK